MTMAHWRTQFEWLTLRSLQLDAQLQPVDYQYLALLWGKFQQLVDSGQSVPASVLVDFVCKLFESMGADDLVWSDEIKPEALPLLGIGMDAGFMLLHARNPDGSWLAEGASGLRQISEIPPGLKFTNVIGCARRKNRGSAKEMFRHALSEHKSFFMYAALATVLMNLLALVTSLYSMQVYDRVIPSQGVDTLFTLTSGVLISILLETMTKFVRSSIMDQAVERMDLKLSHIIFDRLLRVRMDQFPASVGTLSGQLRSYEMIRSFVSSVAIYLLVDTPFALLFLAVIFMIGGIVGAIPLVFFLICLGLGFFFKGRIEAHAKASQAASNRKLGLLVEAVESAEVIKSTGASWHFQGKWNALTRQNMVEDLSTRHISEASGYYSAALQQISYVMLVGIGAYIASTSTNLTSGSLIACSILSGRVLQPVASLPGLMVQWANAKSSMGSLEGVFKLEQDNHDVQQALTLEKIRGDLRLQSVAYAYPGRAQSLDISGLLHIKQGEKVGIIGGIGGGKSTLLKILSGIYRPQKGRALIDGLDMQHIDRGCLSRHIGYLPQQVRLFAGTLRENLTLGLMGISDEQLHQACEITGLIELVSSHSKGFDLPITEGGNGVSGGQRQLIGITRLVLARPTVWLLDEPTASMDDATEMRTLHILGQLIQPDQTLVLVTHKPALLALVGRVIVMGSEGVLGDGLRDAVLTALHEHHNKQNPPQQAPQEEYEQPSEMQVSIGGKKYEAA